MICDCYALNVDFSGYVWLNYYTDFPLIRLREFKLHEAWKKFGSLGNAFAVRGDEIIYRTKEKLSVISTVTEPHDEPLSAVTRDIEGIESMVSPQRGADTAARGSEFIINTGDAIYSTSVRDHSS